MVVVTIFQQMAVKYLKLRALFSVCANALLGLSAVLGASVHQPSSRLRSCLTPCSSLVPPPLPFPFLQPTPKALVLAWELQGKETLESEISTHILSSKGGNACDWKPWVQVPTPASPSERSWASDLAVLGPSFLFYEKCSNIPALEVVRNKRYPEHGRASLAVKHLCPEVSIHKRQDSPQWPWKDLLCYWGGGVLQTT